jgi:hypothetical protein
MSVLHNTFVSGVLRHRFQNPAQARIRDATALPATATAGSLHFTQYTGDLAYNGNQVTSERSYTGIARAAVARAFTWFSVGTKTVGPVAEVRFGKRADVGSVTVYFFYIGIATTGTDTLILRRAIGSPPRLFTVNGKMTIVNPSLALSGNAPITFAPYEGSTFSLSISEVQVLSVASFSTNAFSVTTTQGGVAFTTASGEGSFQPLTPLTVTQNTMQELDVQPLTRFQ